MEMKIYSIRDLVADEFGPIFTAKNDNVALRQTTQLLRKAYNPNDYVLYALGTIDDDADIYPRKVAIQGNFVDLIEALDEGKGPKIPFDINDLRLKTEEVEK